MSNVKVVSKLQVKSVANPKLASAMDEGSRLFLGRFFGVATGIKTGEDTKGNPWTAATGDFAATNEKGEEYRSGVLFLPGGMHEQLLASIEAAYGAPVEFGVDLYAKPAKNPIGYSYEGEIIHSAEAEDKLATLAKALPPRDEFKVLEHEEHEEKAKKPAHHAKK